MRLNSDPSDDEILAFVENWIDILACGDYDLAYASVHHDPYYCWTPDLIRAVINGYGLPEPHRSGQTFEVTPRCTVPGTPRERTVDREHITPDRLANVRHDLPLNGQWSDLTATFRVQAHDDGAIVVLEEIHVF